MNSNTLCTPVDGPVDGGSVSSGVYNLVNFRKGNVTDGTTFLMAVEFTDAECPTTYTLMAPQQPEAFSAKRWEPGLLCR